MIGVCIRYYHENYGGMLQAYATIKLLEKYGIEYEIIRYKKKKDLKFIIKSIPRLFNIILINDKYEAFQKKISIKNNSEFKINDKIRMREFKNFITENFESHLSKINYGYEELKKNAQKYSLVFSGSDQLWSPAGLPTNFYNLMFVPDNIKKVSYASSFGVSEIPWYQKKRTAKFLNRFDNISVRENTGKRIIKDLTGRDVQVVLDPVLMFDKTEWENLIKVKKEYNEKYIFAYFLGANKEHRIAVENLAKQTGLKIVTLRHLDQYVEEDEKFGDYAPYDVDPNKFLNLLRGAEYVCTDSFHGAVFSIIHRKQFVIFNRYDNASKHSKNTRIDSLCQNLKITNCRYCGNIKENLKNKIDYEKVNIRLNELKEKSKKYIDEAFSRINK